MIKAKMLCEESKLLYFINPIVCNQDRPRIE